MNKIARSPGFILLIAGVVILTVNNVIRYTTEGIPDFASGFFDGFGTSLALVGLIAVIRQVRKLRKSN